MTSKTSGLTLSPIIWVGGKYPLLKQLIPLFPQQYNAYWEPFCGSCTVWLNSPPHTSNLSDGNSLLVDTYNAIKQDPIELVHRVKSIPTDQATFLEIRSQPIEQINGEFERAVRFTYINRVGFRGLYRINRSGQCNTPYGHGQKIYWESLLRSCIYMSHRLNSENITITHRDFLNTLQLPGSGDFVYCDPPYHIEKGESQYSAYSSGGFGPQHQIILKEQLDRLNQLGVMWGLNNSNSPFIRNLYRDYPQLDLRGFRSIQHGLSTRKDRIELYIHNYPIAESQFINT